MFLLAVTAVFIFGWKIGGIADLISASSAVLGIWVFVIRSEPIPPELVRLLLLFALLAGYSTLIVVLNAGLDPQIALRTFRAILNLVGGVALASLIQQRYRSPEYPVVAVRFVVFGLVGHAALIIAMFLAPGLREGIYELVGTRRFVNPNAPFALGYRIPGLTYGLAQTSILQACGLLLMPIAVSNLGGARKVAVWLIGGGMLLISIFLTGRSGLAFLLAAMPIILTGRFARTRSLGTAIGRAAASYFVLLLTAGAVLLAAANLLPTAFQDYSLSAAEEVVTVVADPSSSHTLNVMQSMYFLPDDWSWFIWGNSNLGRGDLGSIPSDVGFVLVWHAIGFVGTLLMLLPVAYAVAIVARNRTAYPQFALATVVILVASVVMHLKEVALYTRNQWSLEALLIGVSIYLYHAPASSLYSSCTAKESL